MIARWKKNGSLKKYLSKYVEQNLTRQEIWDFEKRYYSN